MPEHLPSSIGQQASRLHRHSHRPAAAIAAQITPR